MRCPPQREDDPVTVFMGVPTMYSYLLSAYEGMAPDQQAAARAAAGRLRLTVSGSAACPLPVMRRWEELSGLRVPHTGKANAVCLVTCLAQACPIKARGTLPELSCLHGELLAPYSC